MSADGPRISLAQADTLAAHVMRLWNMAEPQCMVVGSVRRRKPDVGDIELVAPLPPEPKKGDPLYESIAESMGASRGALFAPQTKPIGEVVQGVKVGFLAASVRVNTRVDDSEQLVGVQVFRYTPINKGWSILMRTGPDDFGKWFLWRWKNQFGILHDDHHKASIDGNLVDANRTIVPVEDEEACFRIIRVPFVKPEDRAEFVVKERARHSHRQTEALR